MISKSCGYANWPYVRICDKCGAELYPDFWKGRRLKDIFIFPFFLCLTFVFPIYFRSAPITISFISIITGLLLGLVQGLCMIIFLKKSIKGNLCFLSPKYTTMIVIAISISLFFIVYSLLSENYFDFLTMAVVVAYCVTILIPFLWLVRHERHHGHIVME